MADRTSIERLQIEIAAVGVDAAKKALTDVGAAGAASAKQASDAFIRGAQDIANNASVIAAAVKAGNTNIDALKDALDKMTNAELKAEAAAVRMQQAEERAASSIARAAQEAQREAQAQNADATAKERSARATGDLDNKTKSATQSYSAFNRAIGLLAGYFGGQQLITGIDTFTQMEAKLRNVKASADDVTGALHNIYDVSSGSGGGGKPLATILYDVDKLKDGMQGVNPHIKQVDDSMENLSKSTAKAGKAFSDAMEGVPTINGALRNETHNVQSAGEALSQAARDAAQFARESEFAKKEMSTLADISVHTGTSLKTNVDLFAQLSQGAKKYGFEASQMNTVVRAIGNTMRGAAVGSQEADRALVQLTQGINAGVLKGQDLKAMLTSVPKLGEVIAKEVGVDTGYLRTWAETNDITAQQVVNAFLKQDDALEKFGQKVPLTIGAAMENVHTRFEQFLGDSNKMTGAGAAIVSVLGFIADHIEAITVATGTLIALWATVKIAQTIGMIATAFGPWGLAAALVVSTTALILDKLGLLEPLLVSLKGVWDDFSERFLSGLKIWGTAIDNFVQRFISGWTRIKDFFTNVKTAMANMGNASDPNGGSVFNPINGPTADLGANRNGGSYTVPGGGATDSTLVQFMATPGERVTISTPAQAAGHVPHFRDGGANLVTDLGLQNIGFSAASTNSVTGYTAPSATSAPSIGGVSSAANDNADPADAIAQALSIYSTVPLLFQRQVDALSYMRKDPASTAYITDEMAGLLSRGLNVRMIYDGFSAASVKAGPQWIEEDGPEQQAYDKAQINYSTMSNDKNPFAMYRGGQAQADIDLAVLTNAGALRWNDAKRLYESRQNGNFERTHARDGLDYLVPGGGGVDTRMLNLAVSPGERVSVQTPAQQREATRQTGGGKQVVVQMTVNTPDANSFRKSQTQTLQELQTKLNRIARR